MARSIWKGPFVEESVIKKVDKQKNDTNKRPIKIGQGNQQLFLIL